MSLKQLIKQLILAFSYTIKVCSWEKRKRSSKHKSRNFKRLKISKPALSSLTSQKQQSLLLTALSDSRQRCTTAINTGTSRESKRSGRNKRKSWPLNLKATHSHRRFNRIASMNWDLPGKMLTTSMNPTLDRSISGSPSDHPGHATKSSLTCKILKRLLKKEVWKCS